MKAVPFIVLGIFACISLILYLAGCGISGNWYPLFVLIPAAIALFFAYALSRTLDDYYEKTSVFSFTSDSALFLLVCCAVVAIGLPFTFYRCGVLDLFSLLMHIGGDVAAAIGAVVFIVVLKKYNSYGY